MHVSRWSISLLLALLLGACAGSPLVSPAPTDPRIAPRPTPVVRSAVEPTGFAVVRAARAMLGTPYRYGGKSPRGFDCSGLVSFAYQQAGIHVPRSSAGQYRSAIRIPLDRLQPGDLLFFRLSPPKVSHVGIYDRSGRFIHAPSSGKQVRYASLDQPYWSKHLVAAGRFR